MVEKWLQRKYGGVIVDSLFEVYYIFIHDLPKHLSHEPLYESLISSMALPLYLSYLNHGFSFQLLTLRKCFI